jgi:2-haloacid dehalogenase
MINNNHHLPTIIFDFGGVLIDWDARYLYRKIFQGDEEAMTRFFEEVDFYEWNVQQDAGRPFSEAVEVLSRQHPAFSDLIRAYDTRWEESIGGPIQPVVEILSSLKNSGYPLAALSNWSAEKFQLIRKNYRFLEWFETIIISGEVKLVKPDPRIYLLLLERIQRPAEECIFIDDSASNIQAAQEFGIQTIHFQSPGQLKTELHQMGIQ